MDPHPKEVAADQRARRKRSPPPKLKQPPLKVQVRLILSMTEIISDYNLCFTLGRRGRPKRKEEEPKSSEEDGEENDDDAEGDDE